MMLWDPPHAVSDELDVVLGIEMARRLDEAEIAFVNQIEKRDTELTIAARVRHHEAQVAFDQRIKRRVVLLLLNAPAEFAFLFDRETGELGDHLKVGLQRCGFRG